MPSANSLRLASPNITAPSSSSCASASAVVSVLPYTFSFRRRKGGHYTLCYLSSWISPLQAGGNDCVRILIKWSTVAAGSGIFLLIRNILNFSFAPFKM